MNYLKCWWWKRQPSRIPVSISSWIITFVDDIRVAFNMCIGQILKNILLLLSAQGSFYHILAGHFNKRMWGTFHWLIAYRKISNRRARLDSGWGLFYLKTLKHIPKNDLHFLHTHFKVALDSYDCSPIIYSNVASRLLYQLWLLQALNLIRPSMKIINLNIHHDKFPICPFYVFPQAVHHQRHYCIMYDMSSPKCQSMVI